MLNSLILGDNLEVLKSLPDNSVDLCYIDPPFFSNRNYAVIWGDKGEVRSFEDCWDGGVDTYINWMYKRVEQIHRILKPTGSFYLHCDWHADAYLRVYVLDKIFGRDNFLNEIIWSYSTGGASKKHLSRKHDNIFWYAKNIKKYQFYPERIPEERTEKSLKRAQNPTGARISSDNVLKLPGDVWQIQALNPMEKERIGYPTQKPEALLERIIKASSNEGDVVLDCFMGGGTTIAVAQKLGRNWIGIDQSPAAFGVTRARLDILTDQGVFGKIPFEVRTQKYDYDEIRNSDAFEFEKWIVEKFGGKNNEKQRGDFGLDGVLKAGNVPNLQGDLMAQDVAWTAESFDIVIQVKRSDNIGRNVIDNLHSAMRRFNKDLKMAYLLAFSFGSGAKQEVARLEREENIEIRLVEVSKIIPLSTRPKIKLVVKENKEAGYWEFVIENKDKSQIEFYTLQIFEKTKTGDWETKIFENFLKENTYNQALKKGEYKIIATATDEFGLVGREEVSVVVG